MDHQQRFVVGVGSRGAPVETACDHGFVVDHGELVMEFVAMGEAGSADLLMGASLIQGCDQDHRPQ